LSCPFSQFDVFKMKLISRKKKDCVMNSMVVVSSNFELNSALWNLFKLTGVV